MPLRKLNRFPHSPSMSDIYSSRHSCRPHICPVLSLFRLPGRAKFEQNTRFYSHFQVRRGAVRNENTGFQAINRSSSVISGSAICRPSNVTDRLLYFKSINSVSKGKSSREVSSGAEDSEAVLSSEVSSDETASIPPADDFSGCIVCLRSANRSVVISSASTMTTAAAYGGGGAGERMKNRPQRCRAAFPAQAGGDVRRFSTSRKFFCVSYRFSFSRMGGSPMKANRQSKFCLLQDTQIIGKQYLWGRTRYHITVHAVFSSRAGNASAPQGQ